MGILYLPIKKKWFDMIKDGVKLEEYREIKDYWCRRFINSNDEIEFRFWEEMINDMQKPFHRHNGPKELLDYFDVKIKQFDIVEFRNGYGKNAPKIKMKIDDILINTGHDTWGAEHGKYYFVIRLGEML